MLILLIANTVLLVIILFLVVGISRSVVKYFEHMAEMEEILQLQKLNIRRLLNWAGGVAEEPRETNFG